MDFELWNLTSHLYSFYSVYAITKLLSLTFFGPVNLITEESVLKLSWGKKREKKELPQKI